MNHSHLTALGTFREASISMRPAQPEKKKCNFKARAVYTRKGYRGIREMIVDVIEISPTQLTVKCKFPSILPDDFTLILGGRQHGIGCSVVNRIGDRLHCNLIRHENGAIVSYLCSIRNPELTLEEITHPLFPVSLVEGSFGQWK
jgi:hypothetical protein